MLLTGHGRPAHFEILAYSNLKPWIPCKPREEMSRKCIGLSRKRRNLALEVGNPHAAQKRFYFCLQWESVSQRFSIFSPKLRHNPAYVHLLKSKKYLV